VVAAVTLGLVITIGLWWTYFDRLAGSAEEHLRAHEDPVLAAADAYSYIHLAIVAGIIIFAVGVKAEVHDAAAELSDAARLALCGGVAIFLVGLTAFRLRLVGSSSWEKLTAAAAVMLIFVVGSGLPAWAVAGAVTLVLAALCARETMLERASRGLARK
jgi:low temperature requirement protein LtrA